MKSLYRGSISSVSVSRLLPALILASLLFSLLPALSPPLAVAQDGDLTTPTAEVQEADEPAPIPEDQENTEPTPTPDEQASESPDPIAEQQGGGVASYRAEARSCPPGFDLAAGDASAALAGCVEPLAGVAITLGTQNPNYPGDTRTTGGDGVVVWPDIPLGTGYSVTQSASQGSGDPWVYCEVTGGPAADQYVFYPAAGGHLDVGLIDPNLANYAQTSCRWFNVQSGDPALALTPDANAAAGEVHLTNYLCPVNYNTSDMTLGALKAACTTAGEGFSFTLTAGTGGPRTDTTNAQGALVWTDVPSGTLTIAESIPEGIQFAQPYCSVSPVGSGPGSPQLSLVQSDGKTISGQVAPGQALHCELFNVPVPESTLAVIPFLCPSDYNTSDMTLHALTVGCSIPGLNIEITVTTVEGEQLTSTTGSNGFVEWKGIPSATVKIEQTAPEGYLAGPTYCDPAPPAGELDGSNWQSPTYEGNVVSFDIPDRYTLNCVSFYVEGVAPTVVAAGTGTGSVTVQGYICADELYDSAGTLQNYLDLCQTPHDGASVRLFSAESGTDQTGEIAGGAPLSFPDVPPGETEVNLLGDSSQNRLFCATYPGGEAVPPISAYAEAPVTVGIEGGYETSCYWFSFQKLPDDAYVTITVAKHLCGPDVPETIMVEDWRATCTDPHAGVTFNVEHVGGPIATETTGDDGMVTFNVLPGDVYIQPTPPDSLATGYAWCGAEAPGAAPSYVNAGRINAGEPAVPLSNIDPALVYSCEWFTTPLDDSPNMANGAGYVTVLKWRCPTDFDTSSASLEQMREACPTPQPGVTIGVDYESGESFTQLTRLEKGPAIARFEELPTGEVRIGELGPSGHELQRVICSTGDIGQTGFGKVTGYMEYPVANGGIAATIESGKALDCHFFNVPVEGDDVPPTAGMVYLDSRICPPGFAAVGSSYVDIAMYCSSEPGVEFKIAQGETELVAITNESGLARFTDVPTGAVRIATYPREGYDQPRVFCRFTLEGEGSTGSLDPVTVDNWAVPSELKADYFMECVWANMPAATTSTDPAKIVLQMHVCPEATDPYASLAVLLDTCSSGPDGVTFTAGQPLANPQEAKTDASAGIAFDNLSPGFNRVNMVSAQGYKPVAAWCGYVTSSSAQQVSRFYAEPLNLYLAGGHSAECRWFTVPYVEPMPVDIGVNVSICLPYYEFWVADLEYLSLNCTPEAGVDITVANGFGTYERTVTTSVTGLAVFEQVPSKGLTFSERSPDHRTVRVFCGTAATGYTSVPFAADAVEHVAKNENVTCYWFTIDTTYARVTLYKYACPEDYLPSGQADDQMLQACPTPLEGVRFDFDASGQNYDVTDDEGIAGSNELTPGSMTITETPPLDYSGAIVFCRDIDPSQPEPAFAQVPAENLTIEREVAGGNELECHWFNTKTNDATVIIHKYACPEGYLPQSNSYQGILVKCSVPLEGVTFTLGGPATELSRDTDAAGNVTWEDVTPGSLFISEAPPTGYENAVVHCASYPAGGPQTAFEHVPVEQLAIEREVAAGDTLECFWFNYADPDQPSPTPTATPAPGNPIVQPGTPTPAPDAPATLIITKHTCAAGYDLYDAEADPATDCEELAPDIEFTLAALDQSSAPAESVATTDSDGVVTFTDLAPGQWLLTETLPDNTLAAFISTCESDRRDFALDNPFDPFAYAGPEGQIGVTLIPGETLACDSYVVLQGAVTLLAYQCPSVADTITACEPATEPLSVSFTPVDGGKAFALITDESGVASAEIPAGIYALTDLPASVCLIESGAFDVDDQLVVEYGQPIEVRISTCGSGS